MYATVSAQRDEMQDVKMERYGAIRWRGDWRRTVRIPAGKVSQA